MVPENESSSTTVTMIAFTNLHAQKRYYKHSSLFRDRNDSKVSIKSKFHGILKAGGIQSVQRHPHLGHLQSIHVRAFSKRKKKKEFPRRLSLRRPNFQRKVPSLTFPSSSQEISRDFFKDFHLRREKSAIFQQKVPFLANQH
ncbi:hypothetical protein DM860_013024 [Cuscuta australis]|uniref:Uncharacterized protein n=1 Tax=Cuscuta australis TaxID=267555 RepID=A0A328D7B8_9ASTE|nr:hypothetical protein DM860_013024 [Cuscuta australis]